MTYSKIGGGLTAFSICILTIHFTYLIKLRCLVNRWPSKRKSSSFEAIVSLFHLQSFDKRLHSFPVGILGFLGDNRNVFLRFADPAIIKLQFLPRPLIRRSLITSSKTMGWILLFHSTSWTYCKHKPVHP